MTTALTSSNRGNIPAVCRIKGRGTAVLVSPGILLTSRHVTSSPEVAAQLTAVFFEGSKKKTVEVKLLPQKLFFEALYPAYMDYCLVACEEYGIFNVTPVSLPLTQDEWSPVREGDIILVVQHPVWEDGVGDDGTTTDESESGENSSYAEIKRFEEVLRCRNDLYYLKANGNLRTVGCPAFNDCGQLIGMQSQLRSEGGGVVNRVVSIASIVKHLFANKQLQHIQQKCGFDNVWNTWYVKDDISRIVLILENFADCEIARATAEKLCEHTCSPNLIEAIVTSGGVEWILFSANQFKEDMAMVCTCIRAMWNVSFGETNALRLLVEGGGVDMVLDAMEKYPENEEIAEFSVVLLHNISTGSFRPDFTGPLGHRALMLVHAALQRFKETTVLQKFGFSFFTTLLYVDLENAETLVKLNIVEHTVYVAERNQDQVFLMEALMNFIGELAQHRKAIDLCFVTGGLASSAGQHVLEVLTSLLIDIMFKYQEMDTILLQGNRALWGIGNDLACRAMILQNPRSYEALKLSLPALMAKARIWRREMTSREENTPLPAQGVNVVSEEDLTESADVQQPMKLEGPTRLQRESTRVSVHEPHLPASGAPGPSISPKRLCAASTRSEGKRTPALSECSRTLTPVLATHRMDAVNVDVLNSSPHTAMLQHGGHRVAANYHTNMETLSTPVETKAVHATYGSDEDLDIHSLGERLTDVLESSIRSAVSASQRGDMHNTLGRAAFHIFKGNVGAGVFLLPTYYKDAGYGVGSVVVLLLGLLMIDCALALVRSKQKIDLVTVRTYPAVVGHVLGGTLMHFTNFSLIFTQFGFCVVYIQYASSMFTALSSATHSYQLLVFVSTLMVTPMTLFSHHMGMLAYASMIAAIFVVIVLAGALGEEVDYLSTRGVSQGTVFFEPAMRILVFISGHMFSLEGIGVVLPVENSMAAEDRPRFSKLVKYTLASIVTIYVVFGVLGYLAFGEALQTSVVLAMPPSKTKAVLQVLLGLSLIFSYPIQFLPAIQLVDRALGINTYDEQWKAQLVRVVLNVFFGALAASIGADTINVFASFLGAFTGVHLMITMPVLLALFTDRVLNNAQEDVEINFSDYIKLFFAMPDTIVECRWYLYLFIAMLVWIGGTYYTFDSVFG